MALLYAGGEYLVVSAFYLLAFMSKEEFQKKFTDSLFEPIFTPDGHEH